jgi:hypothetical protein
MRSERLQSAAGMSPKSNLMESFFGALKSNEELETLEWLLIDASPSSLGPP